jgi:hypothetical protein
VNTNTLDVHSADDFRKLLSLAGKTIECSWFIGAIRHRSDGRWVPVIMFADEDHKKFSYAFEIRGGGAECEAFCSRLKKVGWECDELNGGKPSE